MEGFLLVALIFLGLAGIWYLQSPGFKGSLGESRVNSSLRRYLNSEEYQLFDDLTLPTRGGTTQVDHIVVSRFGIFVVETKNMKGWIFGDADQAKWTQVIYGHKTQIQNPIRQNFRHVKAVQELLGIEERFIHNVVAFVGSGEPKTHMPDNVVWDAHSLVDFIRSKRSIVFEAGEVGIMASSLSADKFQTSKEVRRDHIHHVQTQVAKRESSGESCPRCGSHLVQRTNKETGENFLGCSRFPKCRGTRQIS